MSTEVKFFFAFVVVLALIGGAAWLVRRFGGGGLTAGANRGRLPRLAVVDAAPVDNRRRLVLVRRDNVEHLVMIGGPTDVVVETNIARAPLPRGAGEPARGGLAEGHGWTDPEMPHDELPMAHEPAFAPEPPPAPRPARHPAPAADEARRAAMPPLRSEPMREPRLPGIRGEPAPRAEAELRAEPRLERDDMMRPMPRRELRMDEPELEAAPPVTERHEPRAEPRHEPRPEMRPRPPLPPRPPRAAEPAARPPRAPETEAPAPAAAPQLSEADQNLAEMAQRLEAALRRPGMPPRAEPADSHAHHAPAPTPERTSAPPVVPEAAARPVPRPPGPPRAATPAAEPEAPKSEFDSLEAEMASLLGRPKNPS